MTERLSLPDASPDQVLAHVHDYDEEGDCVHCGRDLFAGADPDGNDEYRLTDAGRTTAAVVSGPPPPPGDLPAIAAYAALTALSRETSPGQALADWAVLPELARDEWRASAAAAVNAARLAQPEELRAAMAEAGKVRDVACKLLDLFSAPDDRRMRHASVTAKTLERYAAEAGVRP